MVEGEGRAGCEQRVDGAPVRSGGVASRARGGEAGGEEQVGDGEDGAPGVAALGAVGAELFEVSGGSDAGFLLEFAFGRLEGLLVLAHEAARQRGPPPVGVDAPCHDEAVQGAVDDRQGDDVDRDREGERGGHEVILPRLRRVDIK